jgi:hypothetical protein
MEGGALKPERPSTWFRILRRLRLACNSVRFRFLSNERIFSEIYEARTWGDAESRSGTGSKLSSTTAVRAALSRWIQELGVESLLDAPCGDYNWMRECVRDVGHYIGADIVEALIERNRRDHGGPAREFVLCDLVRDPLPRADAVLCRDGLVHLKLAAALQAVENIASSGSTYLMATTFENVARNEDIVTGFWRPLDLSKPPFCFPAPLQLVEERRDPDSGLVKQLGLWKIDALSPRELA